MTGNPSSTIITFSQILGDSLGNLDFWARSPIQKSGLSSIGFVPKGKNYFPEMSVYNATQSAKPYLSGTLIGYGGSMGGYAVLRYAALIGLHRGFVFSPQFSVDPSEAPFDRYRTEAFFKPEFHSGMGIRPEHIAGDIQVFYDPYEIVDRMHVDRLKESIGDAVQCIPVFGTSHSTVSVISETRAFESMLALPFDATTAFQFMRERKKRSQTYKLYMSSRAYRANRKRLFSRLFKEALSDGADRHFSYNIMFECARKAGNSADMMLFALGSAHNLYRGGDPSAAKWLSARMRESGAEDQAIRIDNACNDAARSSV